MAHNSELSAQFRNFVLCFYQILRVQVSICTHLLVQLLLLAQSVFGILDTLLQILNRKLAHLELLLKLCVLLPSFGFATTVLFALLFKLKYQLALFFSLLSEAVQLRFEVNDCVRLLFQLVVFQIHLNLCNMGVVLFLFNLFYQVGLVLSLLFIIFVQLCYLFFVGLYILL